MSRGSRYLFAAAAAFVLFGLLYGINGYPLLDPDEGRNAEIAREMAESNDYLLPRLNALPYPDKPVLYFAAVAASIDLLGPTELAARLPSLLFALATLGVTWWFARRLYGEEVAWCAALAAASMPLTLGFSRTVIFDSAVGFFVTVAVTAFYLAGERDAEPPEPGRSNWWPALAWGAVALGVLTKGPIALALPLMIAVPYVAWRRRWKAVLDPVGILLFVAVVLPWVRLMSDRVPDYLGYVLRTETFERLTTPALQRTGPWWYFLPILIAGTLPWSAVVCGALRRPGQAKDRRLVFLALWVLVPLVFFSLSQSKRPQYLVPLLPGVALLAAAGWSRRGVLAAAGVLDVFGIALVPLAPRLAPLIRSMTPGIASAIPGTGIALGVVCVLSAALALFLSQRSKAGAVLTFVLPVASIPLISGRLLDEIGRQRSSAELARAIRPVLLEGTEIVGVHAWPPSLPFYLERPLILSTADGRELTSNYLARFLEPWRDAPGTPLRPADWWKEAAIDCGQPRIFVVRNGDAEAWQFFSERLVVIGASARYTAFGPCGRASLAVAPSPPPRSPRESGIR